MSSAPPKADAQALAGIRVLDLSRVLAGPWCTQTLADLGADVIKIERPPGPDHPGGDDTRTWGPPFLKDRSGADTSDAAYYLGTNRNKRSVTVDLASSAGQALIRRMVEHCDVFVENYKVGDMARYGLDAASLLALNPRLVYCSVTGFGQTGPYRERAGYDYAIQGMGGLMSVTGPGRHEIADDAPGGGPQKVGVAVADLFTGLYATTAILAALRHRDRTGQGQAIDMALLDSQVAMLANLGAGYLTTGVAPQRAGNAHQNIVPYQVFEVADGHVILAVGNDGQYARFCRVAGRPDLATDPRFVRNADRVRNRSILVPLLAAEMKRRPRQDWLERPRTGQGSLRSDQRSVRGLRRSARAGAPDDGRDVPSAGGPCAPGRQPDEAVDDTGPISARAAAARCRHRGRAGRVRPHAGRDRGPPRIRRNLRR